MAEALKDAAFVIAGKDGVWTQAAILRRVINVSRALIASCREPVTVRDTDGSHVGNCSGCGHYVVGGDYCGGCGSPITWK